MSTTHTPTDPRAARSPSSRVYRGRSIAELIPKIEAELGAEAIVMRRHTGLEGGIAGFFQRPFVEIEAQPGSGRLDLYDGLPATPPPPAVAALPLGGPANITEGERAGRTGADRRAPGGGSAITAPAAFQALDFASVLAPASGGELPGDDAFASALAAAGLNVRAGSPAAAGAASRAAAQPAATVAASAAAAEPAATVAASAAAAEPAATVAASAAAAAATPPPVDTASRTQRSVRRLLLDAGIDATLAEELLAEAKAHLLPFDPRGGLRRAVGSALQRRIPAGSPLPRHGALIALVGPGGSGKTRCVAALAGAYRAAGEIPVGCASILATPEQQTLRMLMAPRLSTPLDAGSPRALRAVAQARDAGIALLDTPSLSPADSRTIRELARLLGEMGPDRVIVALPATLSRAAATKLLTALRPLRADALAITHLDGADQIGVALEAACTFGLAPEYLLSSSRGRRVLARVDPATLTERVLG